ncbi:MAG: Fe-S cluster assembly sulfur transfer protein SufU [Chloroflexota bacterium]
MALDDLYREIILDHYQSPRGRGELPDASVRVHGHNPLCGDEVDVMVKIDQGRVVDIAFSGRGCSISQASASMMTEGVKGLPNEEVSDLVGGFREMMVGNGSLDGLNGNEELEALQGVKKYPVRVKCAMLPWNALREALEQYRNGVSNAEKEITDA